MICGWRLSTCWHRKAMYTSIRIMFGTWSRSAECARRIRSSSWRLRWRRVDLTDAASEADATAWWESLTESGGEGMVVKPLGFVQKGRRDLAQPAVKCRGREYLRIIYGPEYTRSEHLTRLRQRRSAESDRSPSASSRSAWNHWNGSCVMSRSGVFTNASLAYWRSKASPSIHGSSCALMHLERLFRISAPNWHIGHIPVFRL